MPKKKKPKGKHLVRFVNDEIAIVESRLSKVVLPPFEVIVFASDLAPGEVDLEAEVKAGRVTRWWADETVGNEARMRKLQAHRIRNKGKLAFAVNEAVLRQLRGKSEDKPAPDRRTKANRD